MRRTFLALTARIRRSDTSVFDRSWASVLVSSWAFVLLFGCASTGIISNREPDDLLPVLEGEGVFHRVQAGETVSSIAQKYQVPVSDLVEVNDLQRPNVLLVDDVLFVPTQPLQARPLPKRVSSTVGKDTPKPAVKDAEPKETPRAPAPPPELKAMEGGAQGNAMFRWPVDGVVTSRYGVRGGRKHDGIDLSAPEGTPIVAGADGVVLYSGDEQRGYGRLLILRHAHGFLTIYAHNQVNLAKEGEFVKAGQVIARVGRTGRADGPHLHFEVRQGEHPRNPVQFLPR